MGQKVNPIGLRLGIQAGTGAPCGMPPQPPNNASSQKLVIAV